MKYDWGKVDSERLIVSERRLGSLNSLNHVAEEKFQKIVWEEWLAAISASASRLMLNEHSTIMKKSERMYRKTQNVEIQRRHGF